MINPETPHNQSLSHLDLSPEKLPAAELTGLRLAHVYTTHSYINFLNQLVANRANYLIAGNGVLTTLIVLRLKDISLLKMGWPVIMLLTGTGCFILSLILAVWTLLPQTKDAGSPFHITWIQSQTLDEYSSYVSNMEIEDMMKDVARENHVVSSIVEAKSKKVRLSANFLLLGIGLTLIGSMSSGFWGSWDR